MNKELRNIDSNTNISKTDSELLITRKAVATFWQKFNLYSGLVIVIAYFTWLIYFHKESFYSKYSLLTNPINFDSIIFYGFILFYIIDTIAFTIFGQIFIKVNKYSISITCNFLPKFIKKQIPVSEISKISVVKNNLYFRYQTSKYAIQILSKENKKTNKQKHKTINLINNLPCQNQADLIVQEINNFITKSKKKPLGTKL